MTSHTPFPLPSFFLPSSVRHHGLAVYLGQRSSLLGTLRFSRPGLLRASASLSERSPALSWYTSDLSSEFNGWAFEEETVTRDTGREGPPKFVIAGIGASLAVLVGLTTQFSLSRQGFKVHWCSPLSVLQGLSQRTESQHELNEIADSGDSNGTMFAEESERESPADDIRETVASEITKEDIKVKHVIIPAAVDSTQQGALNLLRSLKMIEDDVKANELCTRREYARWLVQINSSLERNPKRRIVPTISLSGSTIPAFDDVGVEDPDFSYIQALAEAGIIPSKLLVDNSRHHSESQGVLLFFPEKFISRQDLINWRVQLEYEFFPGIEEQISRSKVGFMDVKKVGVHTPPEFFMDLFADGQSIIKKVFGQTKRFQPMKPSTKGQAAVALVSGRMEEVIEAELSRLEAENSARQLEMEEIRSELLGRGDMKMVWDERMKEEATRNVLIENDYAAALGDLEQERIIQQKTIEDHVKERAALECQRQLLLSLRKEVDKMSGTLSSERATYVVEQKNVQETTGELQTMQEGLLDTKFILEAEKEALQILRSWVEDEAKKSQTRSKVLEEVGKRWRWNNQS